MTTKHLHKCPIVRDPSSKYLDFKRCLCFIGTPVSCAAQIIVHLDSVLYLYTYTKIHTKYFISIFIT